LPGHGARPAQDHVLHALTEFADQALHSERLALVGLSRGSHIARGLLHLDPDRETGVALVLPGGNPSSDPARSPSHEVRVADPSIRAGPTEAELWALDNISVVQTHDIVENRRHILAPERALFDAAQDARVFENFEFSFGDIEDKTVSDHPSLIVAGRQDSISGYRDAMDLSARFPRATLAVLNCAGHALAWERPEVFRELMRDWLARLPTAGDI
jgi:pimeloyl-ACP methyl ester carboxylesterase